jgi:hypothetical protein
MKSSKEEKTCIFEGTYKDDKKSGYGEFKWASGNVYKGNYQEDLRDGYGVMIWTDGNMYEGMWSKGV